MKAVGKLLVKCFCVLFPFVVLWSYMGRHPLSYVDGEAPYYIWNREKTSTSQEKTYRVVILGDSVANAAYVPEILSGDTINLALGGTTPTENYYTLRDWLDHNPAPDVCYISFKDFHLQREDGFWTRTMYSHRFRLSQNLELLNEAVAYQEPSILTEHYWLDFLSYQMYLPNKYITPFMNASFNQRYKTNTEAMQADELHGGRYIARGTGEYGGTDPILFEEFHVNPMFDRYYRKIIELCVENGITPRIVKLPLPDNEQFTDNYRRTFYAYYDSLQDEYPAVTVDWFPAYPKNRFVDTGHMNSHGALQFSTELRERYPQDFDSEGTDSSDSQETETFSSQKTESFDSQETETFGSQKLDAGQLSAIDDSIRAENKIEWILKWISGKDYTVLFRDDRGDFADRYEEKLREEWGTEGLELYAVPVRAEGAETTDAATGDAAATAGTTTTRNSTARLTVTTGGTGAAATGGSAARSTVTTGGTGAATAGSSAARSTVTTDGTGAATAGDSAARSTVTTGRKGAAVTGGSAARLTVTTGGTSAAATGGSVARSTVTTGGTGAATATTTARDSAARLTVTTGGTVTDAVDSAVTKREDAAPPRIWGISGSGEKTASVPILSTENGLAVQPGPDGPQPWTTAPGDVLGVAVINHSNHSVVCMKSFRYIDEDFALVQ